jgi:hypothetical protein
MSYGKFVAIISTRCGTYKRFVAYSRNPMQQGKPELRLVDEEKDAEPFDTSGDAKFAALAALQERSGKMLSGGFTEYGVRKSLAHSPRRMDGVRAFFKREGENIMGGGSNGPHAAQFLESFKGAAPKVEPVLDWQNAGEDLYAALAVIIDQIDYTNHACMPNEPIAGVLDVVPLERAKTALSAWMNLRIKDRSRSGDGVGG